MSYESDNQVLKKILCTTTGSCEKYPYAYISKKNVEIGVKLFNLAMFAEKVITGKVL